MTVTALTNNLFLMPLNSLTTLAILGGLSMYARALSGRGEWMVPVGLVFGTLIGLIAGIWNLVVPQAAFVLVALVIAAGLLLSVTPRLPDVIAGGGAVVAGCLAGLSGMVPQPGGAVGWLALTAGMLTAAAAGLGVGTIVSSSLSWQAARLIGLAIIGYGGFLLFVIT